MKHIVLSTSYLGPLSYYKALLLSDNALIEQFDSYHKQTYRNRCRILGANGPLDLVVPVVKNSGVKTLVKDIKIDYATRWQNIHWRSLFSAYNSSPFFEYYSPQFEPYFKKKWEYLLDFNIELTRLVVDLLQLDCTFNLTTEYVKNYPFAVDLRDVFSPKEKVCGDVGLDGKQYTQTFHEKFGFIPNLSIVDLLFNCGPESELILTA